MPDIPAEAVQEAIHIAYTAGKHNLGVPGLIWIPPRNATCDPKGSWIIQYPQSKGGTDDE